MTGEDEALSERDDRTWYLCGLAEPRRPCRTPHQHAGSVTLPSNFPSQSNMNRLTRYLVIPLLAIPAVLVSSCATILGGGTTQPVSVVSEPAGATFTVKSSSGLQMASGKTPQTITLPRKNEYQVEFSVPGYQTQSVALAAGFIAVRIARRSDLWAATAVAVLIAIGAVVSLVMTPRDVEHWSQWAALLLMAPAAVVGGALALRRGRRAAA